MEEIKTFKDLKLGDQLFVAVNIDSEPFVGSEEVTSMKYVADDVSAFETIDRSRIKINNRVVSGDSSIHFTEVKYDVSCFVNKVDAINYVQPLIVKAIKQKEEALDKYKTMYERSIAKLKDSLL